MRHEILEVARGCLGTPFRHQGRVPGRGLDCVGLLIVIARRLEMPVLDRLDYDRRPAHSQLEKQLILSGLSPVEGHMGPGDVALFKIERAPQHVAVLGEKDTMIHAYMQARRVVEHRLDALWQDRFVRAYRFPGVSPWQP